MVGYGLDFSITYNTSKKLEKSLMTMFYENNIIELLPNETLENNVNLEFYTFANPEYTGEYKIRAKYDSLFSNEINVYIHEPVGFEKEVYEFLKYENNVNHSLTFNKIYLDSVKEKLLKLYPTSQYAPALCYEILTNLSHDRDSSKFFEIFDSYMLHNKNKISTINIIGAFAVFIKSYNYNLSNNFISQLEQLKTKYELDESMRRSIDRFIKLNYYNDKNWCKH